MPNIWIAYQISCLSWPQEILLPFFLFLAFFLLKWGRLRVVRSICCPHVLLLLLQANQYAVTNVRNKLVYTHTHTYTYTQTNTKRKQ